MKRLLLFILLLVLIFPLLTSPSELAVAQESTEEPAATEEPVVTEEPEVTEAPLPSAETLRQTITDLESTEEAVVVDPEAQAAPHFATGETFALVWVERANLRTQPSTEEGRVVSIALAGDRFTILGAYYPEENTVIDPDSDFGELVFDDPNEREVWYLIKVRGGAAWIFGGVVLVANSDQLPIGERDLTPEEEAYLQQQLFQATGTVGVSNTIRLRSGPGTNFGVVDVVDYPGRVRIMGRNAYGTWAYVEYSGRLGWVSSFYLAFPPGYQFGDIPVIP